MQSGRVAGLAATLVLFAILPHLSSHATDVADDLGQTEGPYVLTLEVDKVTMQQPTGIQGSVVNLAGDPIPGASIAYVGPGADVERVAVAGPDGAFRIVGMDPGPWTVTVTANGYTARRVVSVTVYAGTMAPVTMRLHKAPSFGSQLTRFGVVHAWVAAMATMGLLLWTHHASGSTANVSSPSRRSAIAVGVLGGTTVGASAAFLAYMQYHNVGLEPLMPVPPRLDLWWARNNATLLIAHVAMFTGSILGVGAALAARRGCSVVRCVVATAVGGAAAAAGVAAGEAPSSAIWTLRLLGMIREEQSGVMWVVYGAIGLGGSVAVGAAIGLAVGAAVGLARSQAADGVSPS
jgi:hypothetical protein